MFAFVRKLARDRFARRIIAEIAKAGGPIDYVYDAPAFTIKREDSTGHLASTYAAQPAVAFPAALP